MIRPEEPADLDANLPEGKPPNAQLEKLPAVAVEVGGRSGPEPTRYGDWEKNGRCIDF